MYGECVSSIFIRSDLTDASQNYGGAAAYDEDEAAEDDAESFVISSNDIVPRNKRAEHPTSYANCIQCWMTKPLIHI